MAMGVWNRAPTIESCETVFFRVMVSSRLYSIPKNLYSVLDSWDGSYHFVLHVSIVFFAHGSQ